MKATPVTGDPRSLTLLEVNARFMRHEQYQQLVSNIKRDGALTSTPFVWRRPDGAGEVLSGNHRVQAAVDAGLEEIVWLESDDESLLQRANRIAVQLSHNAIAGEDDPALLAQLYSEIDDMELRAYAGLDDRQLELLAEVSVDNLAEPNLDYQTLSLMFLPADADKIVAAFEEAQTMVGKADHRWLARYEDHIRLLDAVSITAKAHDIRNEAAALTYVLDVFERHRDDLAEGYTDDDGQADGNRWVPLSTVVGVDQIPAPVAVLLNQAIDRMVGAGDVSKKARWQAFELLAADFLGGA